MENWVFLSLQEIMMYNEKTYGLRKSNSEKNFKDIMFNFQLSFGLYSFLFFMLYNAWAHWIWSFCKAEETINKMKSNYGVGENICKPYIW